MEKNVEGAGGDQIFADLSNASGQSDWSKFFLGDEGKKAAKIEETKANAEMTRAMAALATQMASQTNERSGAMGNSTIWIIGGSVLAAAIIVTAVIIKKR